MRKILAHAVALVCLYLTFSFALFLGLQVHPLAGNIGVVVSVIVLGLYIYFGVVKKRLRGLLVLLVTLVLVEAAALAVLGATLQ